MAVRFYTTGIGSIDSKNNSFSWLKLLFRKRLPYATKFMWSAILTSLTVTLMYAGLMSVTKTGLKSVFTFPPPVRDRHNYLREVTGIVLGVYLSGVAWMQSVDSVPTAAIAMITYYIIDLFVNWSIMTRPYVLHHILIITVCGGLEIWAHNNPILAMLVCRFLQVEYSTIFHNLSCMVRRYRRLMDTSGQWDFYLLKIPFYLLYVRYRLVELLPLCRETTGILADFTPPMAYLRYGIGAFALLNIYWACEVVVGMIRKK